MSSNWTHTICLPCWQRSNPDRVPQRMLHAPEEPCCFCGDSSTAGIYVRADPATLRCEGQHADDDPPPIQLRLHPDPPEAA